MAFFGPFLGVNFIKKQVPRAIFNMGISRGTFSKIAIFLTQFLIKNGVLFGVIFEIWAIFLLCIVAKNDIFM